MDNKHIIGVFDEEDALMEAVHEVKEKGFRIGEIYSPYPLHEAIEAMGKTSRFAFVAFLYGFAGAAAVLAFMYYTAVIDWPVNYGGKPTNAFPSFIVVTIIITILTVTILSLLTFSVRAKIYPGKAYILPDARSTDDKFVVIFDKSLLKGKQTELEGILKGKGAVEVYEKELKPEN